MKCESDNWHNYVHKKWHTLNLGFTNMSANRIVPVPRNRVSPRTSVAEGILFLSPSIPHFVKSQPMDKKLQAKGNI